MTLRRSDNSHASRVPRAVGLLAAATSAFLLAGCGAGDEEGAGDNLTREVVVLETEAPLRSPAYQTASNALIALAEDGEGIVRFEVEEPEGGLFAGPEVVNPDLVIARGADLEGEGAGENIALDRSRAGRAFVPQPDQDHIVGFQTDDLLEIRTFDAGEPPVRVATSGPRDALFALSADGRTVTSVDLGTFDPVAEKRVNGSEETLIATSPDIDEEFWLAGPEGVSVDAFGTDPFPEGSISLPAAALAVDPENAERAYASERGTGRVVAIEPEEEGLGVVSETDVGEKILHLGVEPGLLFAVTTGRLVTLDSASLEVVDSVELPLEGARPNGVAVGQEGVFVTLEGERRILIASKPPAEG